MAVASRTIQIDTDAMEVALQTLTLAVSAQAEVASEFEETRKALDIAGPDFARVAGISPHRYTNLETGRSRATMAETIRIIEAWIKVAGGDLSEAPPIEEDDETDG